MSLHQRLDASNMASIKLNALDIGSVQVSEGNRQLRSGIDSCAAVTVFPKTVAEDYTVRKTPRQSKELQASVGQAFARFWCKKGACQTPR